MWAVAWSAGVGGEERVLSAGQDGRLVILEAEGGKRVCVHHIHQPIRCVCLSVCLSVCVCDVGDS